MYTLISYMCGFWLDSNLASPVVKLAWTWRFGAETEVCGFMVSTSIIASWSRKQVLWMCTAKTWHRGTGIGGSGRTVGLKYMKAFLRYTDKIGWPMLWRFTTIYQQNEGLYKWVNSGLRTTSNYFWASEVSKNQDFKSQLFSSSDVSNQWIMKLW